MTDSSAARWRPETVAVAAGRPARVPDAPLNQPLVPAATYVGAPATDPTAIGYGRYGNPGWQALEQAIGDLEGGRCLTYGSGMAAGSAILDLFGPGTVVLRPAHCYLGVAAAMAQRVERHGWTVREADPADAEAFLAAARGADLIWLESPTNPMIEVADLAAIAAAREPGSTLVVDNTFATPLLQRPLELGADLVLHSATKIISGHSDALLGAVVAANSDDHDHYGRLEAGRRLGGAIPGSLETYLVLRGLRTLPVRLAAAQASAMILAGRLHDHPAVLRVRYPGLADDPGHARATAGMAGFGTLLSIELADAATADRFIDALGLWVFATSLGGVESMLERRRRWPGELPTVPPGLIRMSVGVEHVEDLWADLDQALAALD
ncbi:trans-sulfuration enzyme family protein [Microlunatus speluncae]|uniref:trans-sulfuration enzyme family protein n=1 Tax=Microlunatus speluncae TaxID=2594267 RepID=UPI0012667AF5|nr:PLP-dependent transferase [Microlunatus speluncae]